MDNPFSADNNNPFQTPYQQPSLPSASTIKPFTAVDLAPPAGQNGNRHSAPAAPAPNPFMGGDFGGAFMNREAPMAGAMQTMAPAQPMHTPAPIAPAAPMANTYAPRPAVPAPMPDYTPAPLAPPAAARQSQILSMTDFNESMNSRKPDFFCTSTPGIDGYQIQNYLGVVSVEIVIPKDILFHNPAAYGELHRMKAAEDQLQKVKVKAFEELAERARALQADGVVGVTLQFSQFDAIVCLCSAVGTAVKIAD
ncbi:MAG: hypothetical protein JWO30_110 [Fibrobacteres bacterium]|nr:hypothetical protein [Fibrobacterota bacterium]